jgi:hypothetical protein
MLIYGVNLCPNYCRADPEMNFLGSWQMSGKSKNPDSEIRIYYGSLIILHDIMISDKIGVLL